MSVIKGGKRVAVLPVAYKVTVHLVVRHNKTKPALNAAVAHD
jgi:hypothetical protein